MESFIPTFLLIILLLLICLICIASLIFIIKVKRGWLWFLCFILIVIGGIKIHDRVINAVFYDFTAEMYKTYPGIEHIELRIIRGGGGCIIDIELEKEIDDKNVESIFINVLKKVNQEPLSSYLRGNTNPKNRTWSFFKINFFGAEGRFESEPYQHSDWFTKKNQEEQTWKNSHTGKIYRYSDYID
ncbi:hypothetical protein [Clostridium sp. HBUAS56010]|uniref:hypothetical protein n=1 Tax=Clostridium sp. HBUAS56010 TaxID=2571127 RepID=UPI001177427B|nr:hypothetical protein [Clostridium sp. HBUAS56010]